MTAADQAAVIFRPALPGGAYARLSSRLRAAGLTFPAVGGSTLATSGGITAALRELASDVAAILDLLEQRPGPLLEASPPPLVQELANGVGRLNRLLEDVVEPEPAPAPAAAGLPTGLTLKAVSRRTGIPAATLRTWERRYGFIRPARSTSGYRLYGEEEVLRILRVKRLRARGIRISAAMTAVAGTGDGPRP
jgi:MerR HTH family regulatory protein